ncbi:hypothetical protein SAMN04488543_2249 [Friedmanniella luteola]|uniref:Uncharacterized protein n=1 Tax=Friedmanniella luteola TaxID=546871 RepID=A0A1H1UGV1_9ACTN|nr:hypothetical protein [Friedmanniella luteola]SDS71600.1 hypothetical protein SAMN04488543_2249 [Friedmanniella luteola]
MRSSALVESPAQLLNVVEWAHQAGEPRDDLTVIVLAPTNEATRRQLRAMSALAREDGLEVLWHEPRLGGAATARTVRSLASELSGVERLVIGDPFSGVLQVVMSISRAPEVVIVDDGTATLEFARQWVAGEHLARWHSVATPGHRRQISHFAREQISGSVRRRISPESGCRLALFTSLDVELPRAHVGRNTFAWVRSRFPVPEVKLGSDLIGTSLVETGVVDADAYLGGVASLVEQYAVDRYFAHRKESDAKLARIEGLGVTVVRPDLPLEIAARLGVLARRVISFPSTVVHTLPLVLADTPAELLVCDIDDRWYTAGTTPNSERFLGAVSASARSRFGLAAVAC